MSLSWRLHFLSILPYTVRMHCVRTVLFSIFFENQGNWWEKGEAGQQNLPLFQMFQVFIIEETV